MLHIFSKHFLYSIIIFNNNIILNQAVEIVERAFNILIIIAMKLFFVKIGGNFNENYDKTTGNFDIHLVKIMGTFGAI